MALLLRRACRARQSTIRARRLTSQITTIKRRVVRCNLARGTSLNDHLSINVDGRFSVYRLRLSSTRMILIRTVSKALHVIITMSPLSQAICNEQGNASMVAVLLSTLMIYLLRNLRQKDVLSRATSRINAQQGRGRVTARLNSIHLSTYLASLSSNGRHGRNDGASSSTRNYRRKTRLINYCHPSNCLGGVLVVRVLCDCSSMLTNETTEPSTTREV